MLCTDRERGSSAIEAVALVAALAATLGVAARAFDGRGDRVATAVARELRAALDGPQRHRIDAAREKVIAVGSSAPLPRSSRTLPMATTPRWWHRLRQWNTSSRAHGARLRFSATLCEGCADARTSWNMYAGGMGTVGRKRANGVSDGIGVSASALAYAALERVAAQEQLTLGNARRGATLTARESAVLGGEATADGVLHLGRTRQEADLEVSAVAGARARAEAAGAVHFAGVALSVSGGAEGWAGAGGEAHGSVRLDRGKATVHAKLGGALGLGGALDAGFTLDLSRVIGQVSMGGKR
jgi:hypothetical protein